MDNIRTPKGEVDNKYLKILAERLAGVRNDNGLSQKELADMSGTIREKIMYAELNIKGRKLQIEELAEMAYQLNVSLDYLVGLKNEKTTIRGEETSNHDETDNYNKEENSSTELDSITRKVTNDLENEEMYQFYTYIDYIIRNTLTSTLEKVKSLIEKKSNLSSMYLNNMGTAYTFICILLTSNLSAFTLTDDKREVLELGNKALGNILIYNEDKELPMFYDDIENMKRELESIRDYLLYNLVDYKIKRQLEDAALTNVQNDKYYQKANDFMKEYKKSHKS